MWSLRFLRASNQCLQHVMNMFVCISCVIAHDVQEAHDGSEGFIVWAPDMYSVQTLMCNV